MTESGVLSYSATQLLSRAEIEKQYTTTDWQRIVFNEFATSMNGRDRPFPCTFGVQGYLDDQLRYAFQDDFDTAGLAPTLGDFLSRARSFGPNTSLVLFLRPGPLQTLETYRIQFWSALSELAALDKSPWPDHIPQALDSKDWEFCFAGEPIFVVCNNPAHVLRQSRRSAGFMMTFQPRWVFERILGTEKLAHRAFATVRKRLEKYDFIAASPELGKYGHENVREFAQYFLNEDNTKTKCPLRSLKATEAEKVI